MGMSAKCVHTTIRTTVHECVRAGYRRRVVFGAPASVSACAEGPRLHFADGAVVAYEVVHGRRGFGCVFRAGSEADEALEVPGVQPAVRLLLPFCRGRRFARAIALLQELQQRGVLETMSDAALLRASAALSRPVSTALLADAVAQCGGRPWIC